MRKQSQLKPFVYALFTQKKKKALAIARKCLILNVDQPGLEPGTSRLWVCCSNQLSYAAIATLFPRYVPPERVELSLSDWKSGVLTVRRTHRLLIDLKRAKSIKLSSFYLENLAEAGGFEPPVRLPVRQFSKLVVSATHPNFLSNQHLFSNAVQMYGKLLDYANLSRIFFSVFLQEKR